MNWQSEFEQILLRKLIIKGCPDVGTSASLIKVNVIPQTAFN